MASDPWQDILLRYEVGSRVRVRIRQIEHFGAFVELEPGVDGLILITNISHQKIEHPNCVFKLGQYVDAVIILINVEAKKISLSTKELEKAG